MKERTWYARSGSKKAELYTILHLPYTAMCLSFLIVGFSIQKPVNCEILAFALLAYFLGLGIGAHALDQLPGQGSSYVQHLTKNELLIISTVSLLTAVAMGFYATFFKGMWHLLWLIPLQTFFAVAYPISKLFHGFFHTDFWFAFSWGFLPVVLGYYSNTLSLSLIVLPYALLCTFIAAIEITLSRTARKIRQTTNVDTITLHKTERALKLLCITSYILAISRIFWS